MTPTVERILAVVRSHRPPSFADPTAYRGELLAALTIDGLDARGDCRTFGGRVDLLVAHADTVAILLCPPGRDADAVLERRLRRLAAGGDIDALILLVLGDRQISVRAPAELPVHVEPVAGADASPEPFAA